MRQIYIIALNTFREGVRNRVFASLIAFAVCLLFLTLAVSQASLHEEVRLVKDMGLFLCSTFSSLICIFIGVNLVYKDVERKTIYTILPKPIYRWQFLLGKYFGIGATMAVQVAVMGLVLFGQFLALDAEFGLLMLKAIWLIYVEVMVVGAVALFFSSFSTPFLSGLLTLGVFVVGRFGDRIATMRLSEDINAATQADPFVAFLKGVAAAAPDLSQFNVTAYVVYDSGLPLSYVYHATAAGFAYAGVVLVLASMAFARRDFT